MTSTKASLKVNCYVNVATPLRSTNSKSKIFRPFKIQISTIFLMCNFVRFKANTILKIGTSRYFFTYKNKDFKLNDYSAAWSFRISPRCPSSFENTNYYNSLDQMTRRTTVKPALHLYYSHM